MFKYFPYYSTIREPQRTIILDVYTFIRSEDYDGMISLAGSGIGKESCMTSQSLLALEDNLFDIIIFIIPTDSGKENILKELCRVIHNKKVIKIFSKEILCNWIKEIEDERISAIEEKEEGCAYYLCKLQGHRCSHKNKDCSYELQREEIKTADIIICDYNYIISPFIRRASGFEEMLREKRCLLLIDECHMLTKRAEMLFSSSISSTTINRAIQELENYNYKEEKDFVEGFLRSIKKETNKNYSLLKSRMKYNYEEIGEVILHAPDIQRFCGLFDIEQAKATADAQTKAIEEMEKLGEILISVGENISNLKFERKEGIVSYTEMLGNFITRFARILRNNKEKFNIFFLKLKKDKETMYIGWTPSDVRGFLKNAITRSDKYILYSGTGKPLRLKNDVGLTKERIFMPETIESPYLINRKDIILTKERFYHKNLKNEAFSKRIKEDLDILFPNMPKPLGIVCTDPWWDCLDLSSIYPILNQPDNQEDVENWLINLAPNVQILRFNPYGRIAQSVDLSLKSMIFLGLPYKRISPITEEKINIMAKNLKGKSGNSKAHATYIEFIEPTYEKIYQSEMRGLRSENDRLIVIYYDVNFKLNKTALGSKNLVVCSTVDEVISHLQNN